MGSLRIRTLGLILVAALVMTGAAFVVGAALIEQEVEVVDQSWRQYQDESSVKARAVDALVTNLGYGGMIHQFKNYVLRQDKPRIRKVLNAAGGAISALRQYQSAGVNAAEEKALSDIEGVINKYTANMDMVQGLAEGGTAARGIDKKVKISDKPALEGITLLASQVSAQRKFDREKDTKTEILSRLRAAMGYGGMIHQFKNYVLRQDEKRIAKVKKAAAAARQAIVDYRKLGANGAEDQALGAIGGVIDNYARNVDVAATMARAGNTPEQIDKKVKISDKPALQGLQNLVFQISQQGVAQRAELTGNLKHAESLSLVIMAVAVVSSFLLIAFSVWVVLFKVVRPVDAMIGTMNQLAEGDTDIRLPQTEDGNEIGEMARAVQVFRDNAVERERLEAEEEKAARERSTREESERKREHEENAARQAHQERVDGLTAEFGATVEEILGVVAASSSEVESSAQSMSEIAKQTQDESVNVASAAEQATVSVQTVASAAEELTSSISEISRQVTHSAEISGRAVAAADGTNQTIRELAEGAQRIGEVVDLINDIANQTNLLALNATIEAARAGEAGKGFAVVASEVKNLAAQTAQATEDISAQIGSIQNTTQDAVGAIEGIGATITEMNEIATTIASAVEEQGAATNEISRNVQEAATGTENVSASIVTVRSGSERTGDASGNVLNASRELAERFQGLRGEVEAFLDKIKAA